MQLPHLTRMAYQSLLDWRGSLCFVGIIQEMLNPGRGLLGIVMHSMRSALMCTIQKKETLYLVGSNATHSAQAVSRASQGSIGYS